MPDSPEELPAKLQLKARIPNKREKRDVDPSLPLALYFVTGMFCLFVIADETSLDPYPLQFQLPIDQQQIGLLARLYRAG